MAATEMGLKREGKRQQKQEGFVIQKLLKRRAARVPSCTTPPPIWRLEASSQHHVHGIHKDSIREVLLHFPTTTVSARKLCACLWQIQPHYTSPLRRRRRPHDISFQQAARCNCEVTPTSSLEIKGRTRESNYNLKTPRELLKVLNRIQIIREQHASNISVEKGLKVELDLSRAQIKELRREKQMSEDKFVRKKNAHEILKVAVQSVEEDLEDDRRGSRRHSESLDRKLAQELSEVKSMFHGSLRELERERKARILLENLCDEFAIRIRDYEQDSRFLKKKSKKNDDLGADRDKHDRLILDVSEAWLDERAQTKVAKAGDDRVEINSIDKLGFDIETFLREKLSVNLREHGNSSPKEIREVQPCQYNSLDSFPPNESISAPVNSGAASGEGHGSVSSIDQEKKGRQISTGKQVQAKQIKTNTSHDDDERWFVDRNDSSDKIAVIKRLRYQLLMRNENRAHKEVIGP